MRSTRTDEVDFGSALIGTLNPDEGQGRTPESLFPPNSDYLDTSIPPMIAFAGARHLELAMRERATLDRMSYEFPERGGTSVEGQAVPIDSWHG